MSLKQSLLALTALGCLGYAAPALAQTCTTNADCSTGFTCQVSGVVTTPACPPDADCAKSDGGTGSNTTTLSTCQPSPCATDSDCGTGMICFSQDATTCSGGAGTTPCSADTKCDSSPVKSDPVVCTTQTSSVCAYRWQLPCNADADCGEGFVCNPSVSGSCSGGTPVSGGAAGGEKGGTVILTNPGDSCTTTTSYPGSCQATVSTCLVDSDCPASWRCVSYADPGATGIGETGAGGSLVADALISPTTPGMCSPPSSTPVAVKNGGTAGAGGATEAGTTDAGAGGSVGASAPSTSGNGGTSGTATGTDSHGQPELGGPAKTVTNDGGCSIDPGVTSSRTGLAAIALVGLGLIARRRRR